MLDWEYAGWGLPAADLPELDLHSYGELAGLAWPQFEYLANLGKLFQCISAICWASTNLAFPSAGKGINKYLRYYPADLRHAIRALGME